MNKRTAKKISQLMNEGLREKYEADDRRIQHHTLKRMSEGAHLYIGDQPDGPDSDVYTWTANLGMSKDAFEGKVMGRDLKKMQEHHLIRYDRHVDEFLLTEDGRVLGQQDEQSK
jgi:hypothetical protein